MSIGKKGLVSQLGAFKTPIIIIVTFSMFATSLLERTFFHNTTFQPGFFMSCEKNTWVAWQGNMKSSDDNGIN
jgi:hypothetical protein